MSEQENQWRPVEGKSLLGQEIEADIHEHEEEWLQLMAFLDANKLHLSWDSYNASLAEAVARIERFPSGNPLDVEAAELIALAPSWQEAFVAAKAAIEGR